MRFHCEQLEQRRLLTIPVTGTSPNLILNLTDSPDLSYITGGDDFLEIRLNGSTLEVRNGAGSLLDSRSASGVAGININAGGGNDLIRIGTASGGSMPNLPVTIHGGTGNDTITGGLNNDQLFGDDGNDLLDGGAGADVMDGGAGFDTADYSYRVISLSVAFDGVANDGTNAGSNSTRGAYNDRGGDNAKNCEAMLGSSVADVLTGNSSANWIDGGGGNDTIYGGDGIDTMFGGVNADLAYGEGGDDYFFFQDSTADQFLGGAGSTIAQYDTTLDKPAPAEALPAALTASTFSSLLANVGPVLTGNLQRDDSFGEGSVLSQLGGFDAKINDVAIQSVYNSETEQYEDKIIAVGTAINPNSESETDYDALIIRYNADGSLDQTFGPDESGFVFTDFSGGEGSIDSFSSVAINGDNQIIAAGTSSSVYGFEPVTLDSVYAIARYNQDGDLDETFGSGIVPGTARFDPNDEISDDRVARVAIQRVYIEGDFYEEEYVLAGTLGPETVPALIAPSGNTHDWGIIRVDNNGDQDFGFGNGGLVQLDYFSGEDYATGLAIDPEYGNIWVSGYTQTTNHSDQLVAGYDSDGNQIPGALNKKSFDVYDFPTAAVISGSQLLVVGTSSLSNEGGGYGMITAYDIYPDSQTLAEAVNWSYVFDDAGSVALNGVTLDGEGHGIAVGSINQDDFYVYRFNASDLSRYGDPITADFGAALDKNSSDIAFGVAVQSDGKIVVGGVAGDPYAALVRFQNEEAPPPFVDVTLSPEDVQNFEFTYIDENGNPQPVPDYLVQRIKALKPDGTFEIFGTPYADNICITQKDGIITANVNGTLMQENAADVTGLLIHALSGDDQICIDCSVTVPATIEGGDGCDTAVGSSKGDLFKGGAGNDMFFGLAGDDVAYGDDGCDVLVGGAGADSLYGGAGRDILIGGRGKDFLRGGAGEDIVIGGYTLFDDGCASFLLKIVQEWNCNDNRSRRVGCLGGNNGGLNAGIFFRTSGWLRTVWDDNETDNCGGEGDNDWFFINNNRKSIGCDITDSTRGEDISSL